MNKASFPMAEPPRQISSTNLSCDVREPRWRSRRPRVRSPGWALALCAMLSGCMTPDPPLPPPPRADSSAAVQQGQQLVNGFGACGFCHSLDGSTTGVLSGGRVLRDSYGDIQSPNITLARSGLGMWTETDFKKAIRSNLRPDGTTIESEFHRGFEWISDADVTAITYYIRSLAPVENEIPRREVSFIERNTIGFFTARVEVKGYIPSIAPTFKTEFGQYLTDHVARCGSCHSMPGGLFTSEEYMAGGKEVSLDGRSKVAPNITTSSVSGIGSWSEGDMKRFLGTGRSPDGREVDPNFCPVRFYANAPQDHIDAVVAYLRTIPAVN